MPCARIQSALRQYRGSDHSDTNNDAQGCKTFQTGPEMVRALLPFHTHGQDTSAALFKLQDDIKMHLGPLAYMA